MQIFDLVDADGSGTLDENEMKQWLEMCGAELDLKTILDVLLKDGNLSRQKFGKQCIMSHCLYSCLNDLEYH